MRYTISNPPMHAPNRGSPNQPLLFDATIKQNGIKKRQCVAKSLELPSVVPPMINRPRSEPPSFRLIRNNNKVAEAYRVANWLIRLKVGASATIITAIANCLGMNSYRIMAVPDL